MFSIKLDITVFGFLCFFFMMAFLPESAFSYSEMTSVLLDICHFPAFWCLQVVFHSILKRTSSLSVQNNVLAATASSFVIAVLLEQIQPYFGRSQNIEDLLLGILGFTFAATHFARLEKLLRKQPTTYLRTAILLLTITVIFPKIYLLQLKLNAMPVLGEFENHFDRLLWRNVNHIRAPALERVKSTRGPEDHALAGQKLDYRWSGISFENRQGFNISDYQYFKLDFFSGNKPTTLFLRIDDINGKKANADEQVTGTNWSSVSFNMVSKEIKNLDTHNISKVAIFFETEKGPNAYRVDNLRFD